MAEHRLDLAQPNLFPVASRSASAPQIESAGKLPFQLPTKDEQASMARMMASVRERLGSKSDPTAYREAVLGKEQPAFDQTRPSQAQRDAARSAHAAKPTQLQRAALAAEQQKQGNNQKGG